MKSRGSYFDLFARKVSVLNPDQTYYFPQDGFDIKVRSRRERLKSGYLFFHNISLK